MMKNRIFIIDFFRFVAILNMVLFHFCYDYFMIFGRNIDWYWNYPIRIWQQCICWTFILVSGISANFGHNNLKKGIILNFCGILISLITFVFIPNEFIFFGVLNLLGCASLFAWCIEKTIPNKKFFLYYLPVLLFLFAVTFHVQEGRLRFLSFSYAVPQQLYCDYISALLGFPFHGFSSSDYYPIVPWCFLFFIGYFGYEGIRNYISNGPILNNKNIIVLISKNSLMIYLLHQPVCFCAAYLLNAIW